MKKRTHILMVDDDPDIRRIFGGYMAEMGLEIYYAHDGNRGREAARRLKPDLILMDVAMPVMDGMEAALRLKTEDVTKDIPIVMLTNFDLSIEAQQRLREFGVNTYLHKSVSMDEFRQTLKKHLKRSR
ncbi:response regulator [Candidatus Uhrbacteria bacterium]|nr:response regulator [Candidatus Uhrbacteria bacterium]